MLSDANADLALARAALLARGPAPAMDEFIPPVLCAGDLHLSTGVRLRCIEQGAPGGRPVVMLHGYTDSGPSFGRLLPLLPSAYRVIVPDQRGHGDSDRPAQGYAMRDLAADVLALMDALDLPRATILGHSMGSFVARTVALMAPGRVEALVLVGGAASPVNPGMLELREAVLAEGEEISEDFVRGFQESCVRLAVPEPFMRDVIAASRRAPARVWRDALDGLMTAEPAAGLEALGIPTLLAWGAHDSVFPPEDRAALRALLPSAAHLEYGDAGHTPHWECPDRFAQDLTAFLARVT